MLFRSAQSLSVVVFFLSFNNFCQITIPSIEESQNLSSSVLLRSLGVIEDTIAGRQHNMSKLSARQQIHNPSGEVVHSHVESRRDDSALVDSAKQMHHDLAVSTVINHLHFSNVSVLHHDMKELEDHFGTRADDDLALSTLLGVVDVDQRVVEGAH